jgi:hypothetical protein
MNALLSFQQEFLVHEPKLKPTLLDTLLDPNLQVHIDTPNGEIRWFFGRVLQR